MECKINPGTGKFNDIQIPRLENEPSSHEKPRSYNRNGAGFTIKLFYHKFFLGHVSYRTARCSVIVPVSHFHQILLSLFQGMVVDDMFRKIPDENPKGNPGFQNGELHGRSVAFNTVTCTLIRHYSGFSIPYLQNDIRLQDR